MFFFIFPTFLKVKNCYINSKIKHTRHFYYTLFLLLIYPLELFCNAQKYNQTGVSWPTGSWLKHSDWLRLRLSEDQSQEMLLGHAIFASSEYRMTQLPSYFTFD